MWRSERGRWEGALLAGRREVDGVWVPASALPPLGCKAVLSPAAHHTVRRPSRPTAATLQPGGGRGAGAWRDPRVRQVRRPPLRPAQARPEGGARRRPRPWGGRGGRCQQGGRAGAPGGGPRAPSAPALMARAHRCFPALPPALPQPEPLSLPFLASPSPGTHPPSLHLPTHLFPHPRRSRCRCPSSRSTLPLPSSALPRPSCRPRRPTPSRVRAPPAGRRRRLRSPAWLLRAGPALPRPPAAAGLPCTRRAQQAAALTRRHPHPSPLHHPHPLHRSRPTSPHPEYYADLRNSQEVKALPVTVRTLETIIRLSCAHAKARAAGVPGCL